MTINSGFSIAMLNYQRVIFRQFQSCLSHLERRSFVRRPLKGKTPRKLPLLGPKELLNFGMDRSMKFGLWIAGEFWSNRYNLWLFNIAMGNCPFIEVYLLKLVIFHGYIK
jgi:hypothetical protein